MSTKQIFNTSAELDYPTVLPTLDLDFANTKALDPRITFTRSSGGSYVGADGILKYAGVNEARFDHNPVTGESLGLLIEVNRQNLNTYSEQLDNARWGNTGFTLSTNTIETTAPDGTNNAEKILETFASSIHIFYSFNAYSITAGTVYTASIFIKSINKQFVQLVFDDNATVNGGYVNFNLSSGTITASANYGTGTSISGTITQFSNGWYRISITSTAGTTSTLGRFCVNGITSGSSGRFPGYVGNTSNGYYIWGAQLEQGSFPTSYIPTSASTVTRSADNASMTGNNFSSWYRQDEGTVSIGCIARRPANVANSADFAITNSFTTTYTSRIVGWFDISSSPFISVFANNINIFLPYVGTPGNSTNIPIKKAIALATRNMIVATNGRIITGNLGNTTVPNYLPNDFNRLFIGVEGIFAGYLNGTISRLTYYPKALPPSQLQALTS